MSRNDVTIINIETDQELTLDEICEACTITKDFVVELYDYGALDPKGISIEVWRFSPEHIQKVKTILRLQNDLDVNLSGALLAVDLMQQIEDMQNRIDILESQVDLHKKI